MCVQKQKDHKRERVYTNAKRLYNSHLDETMNLTVCTEAKNVCIRMQKDSTAVLRMRRKRVYTHAKRQQQQKSSTTILWMRRESVYTNAKRLNNPSDDTINLIEAKRSPTHVKDPVVHVKSSRDSVRKVTQHALKLLESVEC